MKYLLAATALSLTATGSAIGGEDELYGTYSLVGTTYKLVDSGEVETVLNEKGFITYTKEGRMFVIIVRGQRPKAESVAKMTDQQRADLFRSTAAYGGTFKFDGKTVVHSIDISWNELWTGSNQVRHVQRDGNRLIFSTDPQPRAVDGKMSVTSLIWEKMN